MIGRILEYLLGLIFISFDGLVLLRSEVDKPSKILIKTLNAAEYIELDIQNIQTPRTYDRII